MKKHKKEKLGLCPVCGAALGIVATHGGHTCDGKWLTLYSVWCRNSSWEDQTHLIATRIYERKRDAIRAWNEGRVGDWIGFSRFREELVEWFM